MKGWHVLITGGGSGIGLSLAARLARAGATVHLSGRREATLQAAVAQIGANARAYVGDAASATDRQRLFEALAKETGGRLDGLVVNAAKYGFAPLLDMGAEEIEAFFRVNAMSAIHFVQKAHPLLMKGVGKSILFVSSTLGAKPIEGVGAYAASKAAMNSLARSFALELAKDGIRVNAVLPGVVDTPIHNPQSANDPSRADKMEQLGSLHPLGRVGEPDEIAEAAAFLLSPQSSWTTGSLFFVDGGVSLA